MGNNKSRSPEDDEKLKTENFSYNTKQLELFYDDVKKSKPGSDFERLPKNIICLILSHLELKWLGRMSSLNKYFFNLINCSDNAILIWKGMIGNMISEGFDSNEMENYLKNIKLRDYEQKLNTYLLFFKHCFNMKFDPNFKGPSINVSEDKMSVSTENNVKNR
jgi:hypothetical protein